MYNLDAQLARYAVHLNNDLIELSKLLSKTTSNAHSLYLGIFIDINIFECLEYSSIHIVRKIAIFKLLENRHKTFLVVVKSFLFE